jgi:hypothetical protein
MADKLSVEQRKKVAEAVTKEHCEVETGTWRSGKEYCYIWIGGRDSPASRAWDAYDRDFRALVQKTAQLIEAKYNSLAEQYVSAIPAKALDTRLRHALATNDIESIQSLCWGLLEGEG